MFAEFLTNHVPFREFFSVKEQATDFYRSVRCGLLHEARTRGWRIRADGNPKFAIDAEARIVYRHKMGPAFDAFTGWYGAQLRTARELQVAFIRTFDSLAA